MDPQRGGERQRDPDRPEVAARRQRPDQDQREDDDRVDDRVNLQALSCASSPLLPLTGLALPTAGSAGRAGSGGPTSSAVASGRNALAIAIGSSRAAASSNSPAGTSTSDWTKVCGLQKPRSAPPWTNGTQIGAKIIASATPIKAHEDDRERKAHEPADQQIRLLAPEIRPEHRPQARPEPRADGRAGAGLELYVEQGPCDSCVDRREAARDQRQSNQERDHQRRDQKAQAETPDRGERDEPQRRERNRREREQQPTKDPLAVSPRHGLHVRPPGPRADAAAAARRPAASLRPAGHSQLAAAIRARA